MTAPDDVRARFEARVRGWPNYTERTLARDGRYPDYYGNPVVQGAWEGYRAAHADLSGKVRELVEADREYDTARSRYSAAFRDGPNGDLNEQRLAQKHLNDAKARRAAALAKFHPTHQEKP